MILFMCLIVIVAAMLIGIKTTAPHKPTRKPLVTGELFKLELGSGLGVDWTKDWFVSQPILVVKPMMRDLAEEGNGAVNVRCYGCDKKYIPHSEHKVFYKEEKFPGETAIKQKLCDKCFSAYNQDPWANYVLPVMPEPSIFSKGIR